MVSPQSVRNVLSVPKMKGRFVKLLALGLLTDPRAITLATERGEVYVAECKDSTVIVFNTQGEKIRVLDIKGKTGVSLHYDNVMTLDGQGRLLVSDYHGNRLFVMDTHSGQLLHTIGSSGEGLGQFRKPWGLAFTKTGQLAVSEYGNVRTQLFSM